MHTLQVLALCPMMTKRGSNERVLLVHSGTTVCHPLGPWTLTSCTEMKRSRILWSKTFWALKPIFGYGTDFLNGHTGKSLSQSCQSTATKLQHGAARVFSQHKYQLQPHTSPTDQPKLKTLIKQSPDLRLHLTADCYTASATDRYQRPEGSSQSKVKTKLFV